VTLLWAAVVGLSLLAGAVAAAVLRLPARVASLLTAFGGGILLAAVALELVPEADREAGTLLTAAGLLGGTLIYVAADGWLNRDEEMRWTREMMHAAAAGRPMPTPVPRTVAGRAAPDHGKAAAGHPRPDDAEAAGTRADHAEAAGGHPNPDHSEAAGGHPKPDHAEAARGESIAVGLFVDGVPESLALGLTIAEGEIGLALLGGILVGNLVEAYGAAQPIIAGGHTRGFAIRLLGAIGVALAASTVVGGVVDASPELIGTAQAVAAGAVLAVVSISIVPHAFAEVSRAVATATMLGFVAGYLLSV
jgi:ZIP family zinc transporter